MSRSFEKKKAAVLLADRVDFRRAKDTAMRWQSGVTRRELLCNTAFGTAALAAGGIGAYAQPASKPPNIIFILADDLGYADVSCYGRRDFTTPNIDHIAPRGMRFLQ